VVVTHGAAIKVGVWPLLGWPPSSPGLRHLANCLGRAGARVRGRRWRLAAYNRTRRTPISPPGSRWLVFLLVALTGRRLGLWRSW
jgi:hypothetical protein